MWQVAVAQTHNGVPVHWQKARDGVKEKETEKGRNTDRERRIQREKERGVNSPCPRLLLPVKLLNEIRKER